MAGSSETGHLARTSCIGQTAKEPLPRSTKNSNLQRSFERLAADHPGGFFRLDEARGLDVLEAAVVVVALQVAAAVAAGCSHRAAILLGDRAVDPERPQLAAAVVVVDDEGVFDRQDRRVNRDVLQI